MKKDIQQAWTIALTDGSYKQGRSYLQDNKRRFCCLGILVDMYMKATGIGQWVFNKKNNAYAFVSDKQTSLTSLPREVFEWAGLSCSIPEIKEIKAPPNGISLGLANFWLITQANDGGYSFKQIADIINNDL